jgi:hypothetical protein
MCWQLVVASKWFGRVPDAVAPSFETPWKSRAGS